MEGAIETSFTDVYRSNVDEVYRYVHQRCRDHALTEDVIQETFFQAMDSGREPSSITVAWLITVARNRLFDILRRQIRYEEKLTLLASSWPETIDSDPAEWLRVEQALEQVPVHYRLILTLHYVNGSTVPEIAKQLDRTVKSVEGILTRARRAFAEELESTVKRRARE